ncbi:MAG: GIN domain-containing protein [Pedobacter sp.]
MKTSIKNLFAAVLTVAISVTAPAFSNAKEAKKVTVLSEVKSFNKLNIAGNVEVILVQSANQSVQVYDNYYAKNALVQERNGELRISSFEKETLTVVVYANQLNEITASDNATVKTSGKFNALTLEVTLKDQSKASLNTNTIDLFAKVNGKSSLTLSGNTTDYNAIMNGTAAINTDKFVAENSSIQSKNTAVAQQQEVKHELPGTEVLTIF